MTEAQIFDSYCEAKYALNEREPSKWLWHPSSLGYCPRRQWLEAKGVPRTQHPDLQALRAFEAGNLHHREVQEVYDLQGRRVVPVPGEPCLACAEPVGTGSHRAEEYHLVDGARRISGYLDILATDTFERSLNGKAKHLPLDVVGGVRDYLRERYRPSSVGIEVKSVEPGALWYAQTGRPSETHMYQLASMALIHAVTPKQLPFPPEKWLLLLVCRAKDKTGTFPGWLEVPLTDAWIEKAMARLELLNEAWDSGTPPDCLCRKGFGGKEWKWCAYGGDTPMECCSLNLLDGGA